jgi:serine-type D-Ala-D-Ala carboxypeptidase (penicillin-binding protein 5/6)
MSTLLRRAGLALALLAAASAGAQTTARPAPPAIAARQFILVDLASQQVLAESGADQRAEPASLTKLMTAYLVFNAVRDGKLKLEQTLPVSVRAWNERKGGASVMFIDPKMTPTVEELLHGLIVQSGNDAAVALAEGVAGTVEAFVDAMNKQAQAWSLVNTQFRNASGMTDAGHHSSARDVAFVATKIIAEHPKLFPLYSVRSYTFNKIKQDNRNRLLGRDPSVDGMKTGRTDAAGWCLVATSARDGGALGKRRLLSVVLGAASDDARAAESQKLLEWGYSAWELARPIAANQKLATVRLWKGKANEANLGVAAPVTLSVPAGLSAQLKPQVTPTDPLIAPLAAGQAVGTVKIVAPDGTVVGTAPLVALDAVPEAGWFGRTWDALRMKWR